MGYDGKSAVIELTYECNFACPFCYLPWHDHPEIRGFELSTERWKSVIREVWLGGASSITITGGEPLMRPDAIELIEYVKRETTIPRVSVYTNLSKCDAGFFDAVDDTRFNVSTSLQGCETLSEMSGCNRSIREFSEACKKINRTCAELTIGVTLTKRNVCETEEILRVADSLNPAAIQVGVLMIEGRAKEHPELWMTFDEIVEAHKRIELCRGSLRANLVVINELFCSCRKDAIKPIGMPVEYKPDACEAASSYVVIGPDGRHRKCMHVFKCGDDDGCLS